PAAAPESAAPGASASAPTDPDSPTAQERCNDVDTGVCVPPDADDCDCIKQCAKTCEGCAQRCKTTCTECAKGCEPDHWECGDACTSPQMTCPATCIQPQADCVIQCVESGKC
ncbi:MAG: hypothetical protein KC776_07075, partial [Myxococcales bacterium]|nr:hypothetical protein [Myxococcales bacterium]